MEPPRLRTERLLLREFRPDDVAPHAEMSADPETQRFLGGVKAPYEAFANLATHAGHWALRGYGSWVVERVQDGAFLGRVGLWHPEGWPGCEVGWKLAPAAQGRGYATEAARAAVGWAWTARGFDELSSMIVAENVASARVAERLGEVNTGPVELPIGTCDRWMIRRPEGDAAWAFRDATAEDVPRLARVLREAYARFRAIAPPGWTGPAIDEAEYAARLADPDVRTVVSVPGGVHAGQMSWRPSTATSRGPQDPETAYLSQLYVEPAWWGTELASKLMSIALTGARSAGFKHMSLITPLAQGRARRFYERIGWRTSGPPVLDDPFGLPQIPYAIDL
jgi:RimJ/RimL family protein N-acetyltransferase/ribosomal protein S18 acetylase RimI-like enzyme